MPIKRSGLESRLAFDTRHARAVLYGISRLTRRMRRNESLFPPHDNVSLEVGLGVNFLARENGLYFSSDFNAFGFAATVRCKVRSHCSLYHASGS